jgi:serine phosphatase RsbU (regulator of sigma subunit)
MWLGGVKALSVIDLNVFHLPDRAPRLALRSIEIDQEHMDFLKIKETSAADMNGRSNMQFSGVADFSNYPLDLELPFGMNNLTFHFSAIDWSAPHKVSYQYRLKGFDQKWSKVSDENEAVYRRLGPGNYTFEVRAIGAADIWSETVSYSFVVHPPIYQTTFAYFNYGLLTLLMIYGIVRWRTRRIIKERDELEIQVRERTKEIEQQKEEIEQQKDHILETNEELMTLNEAISKQNNEIIDSINYAKRIQAAMLPPETYVSELLNENFILYKPRDIVSGDFYWIKQVNQYIVLVAADCTGHGVPGAFMSMLGMSFLNEIVQRREITQANQVLNELRKQVKYSLRQHGQRDESKDGMDMALCVIDMKSMQMQYTGAHNPLYLIKEVNGTPELNEIKADHMPIGYYHGKDKSFVNHDIQLEMGDTFYIFSDGFIDQKGGEANKKFMSKNFKNLLLEIHDQPLCDQKEILEKRLADWIGNNSQMDDILVIGVRV